MENRARRENGGIDGMITRLNHTENVAFGTSQEGKELSKSSESLILKTQQTSRNPSEIKPFTYCE